ncbi:MAG TPA: hypothetical protein VII73_07375 [Caulobacteraceae bacterium]
MRLRGYEALAIDWGPPVDGEWYGEAAARIAAGLDSLHGPSVLVVHSGAGGLVPSIVEAAPGMVAEILFVDAIVPHPGRSWLETAPVALARKLCELAGEGLLPPWNQWFAVDPAAAMIADPVTRAAFAAELPRVSLTVLEMPAPRSRQWETISSAYLQLSQAYDAEANEAGRRGWRAQREPMHHLSMITEPDRVAAILVAMARAGPP